MKVAEEKARLNTEKIDLTDEATKKEITRVSMLSELDLLELGLWWGETSARPRNYTSAIGLEPYKLSRSDQNFLENARNLLPRFLRGCVMLVQEAMIENSEIQWLWDQLILGRDERQVDLWKKEIARFKDGKILPLMRVRIDGIKDKNGQMKINELTLGNTGSGFTTALEEVFGRYIIGENPSFPDEGVFKRYIETVKKWTGKSEVNVGVVLTPWRALYGAEQKVFVRLANEYSEKHKCGVKFLFGFSTSVEVRSDGVYLENTKLDMIERVFKEYIATQEDAQARGRFDEEKVGQAEEAIIEAYFSGKVLLNPNLLSFLDYKETMAWIFDDRLVSRWVRLLNKDEINGKLRLAQLRQLFAETYVLRDQNGWFSWNGKNYPWRALEELETAKPRSCRIEFENNEIKSCVMDGRKIIERALKEVGQQIREVEKISLWLSQKSFGWEKLPNEWQLCIGIMARVPREISVCLENDRLVINIYEILPKFEKEVVIKLSGGDNKAAGGHGVIVSRGTSRDLWRRRVMEFRQQIVKTRTVVIQKFYEQEEQEIAYYVPRNCLQHSPMPFVKKEKVRARIYTWFWMGPDDVISEIGGVGATCMPSEEGYIVHGRSSAFGAPACVRTSTSGSGIITYSYSPTEGYPKHGFDDSDWRRSWPEKTWPNI